MGNPDQVAKQEAPDQEADVTETKPVTATRVMKITEVRDDLVICQWHVHYAEFPRDKIAGGHDARPGASVTEFSDGSLEIVGADPAPQPAGNVPATTEEIIELPSQPEVV